MVNVGALSGHVSLVRRVRDGNKTVPFLPTLLTFLLLFCDFTKGLGWKGGVAIRLLTTNAATHSANVGATQSIPSVSATSTKQEQPLTLDTTTQLKGKEAMI